MTEATVTHAAATRPILPKPSLLERLTAAARIEGRDLATVIREHLEQHRLECPVPGNLRRLGQSCALPIYYAPGSHAYLVRSEGDELFTAWTLPDACGLASALRRIGGVL